MRISDNGIGMDDDKGPGGLGMQIVELACAQLDTVLTFDKVPHGVDSSFDFAGVISDADTTQPD